jgi:hypothetical protein
VTLRINAFGGGVVLAGSADQRLLTEVATADGYDLGVRGALTAASAPSAYANILDSLGALVTPIMGAVPVTGPTFAKVAVIGIGAGDGGGDNYVYAMVDRDQGDATPYTYGYVAGSDFGSPTVAMLLSGVTVTSAIFSGVFDVRFLPAAASQVTIQLVNLGSREGRTPRNGPGLWVWVTPTGGSTQTIYPISQFDALGTGPSGEYALDSGLVGTNSQQLYFRGIIGYNNHVLGWGFDAEDATDGNGPCRVMFCNLGNPLKWGNDNVAAEGTNRLFTDSDAIVLGSAGELVRAALVYGGRCYFGTNRGLHFIAGYGRDSFLTDGSTPVMKAYNVVGPYAMIEGPDRLMYGVSDQGLWSFDGGGLPTPLFEKLVDENGFSNGYWDLMWTDNAGSVGWPGLTNKNLVWLAVDWERQQVLVGIPFCDATTGFGEGTDTVVLKYHPRTGGFTRQVYEGVIYNAAGYFREEANQPATRWMLTGDVGETIIQRYAHQVTENTSPAMPDPLPTFSAGPYALFSPDGAGTVTRAYVTLSWYSSASWPLVFTVLVTVDGVTVSNYTLTVDDTAPVSPVAGDVWVDTSQTNTSIGNASTGLNIPAYGGYLAFIRNAGSWVHLAGLGASNTRQTIPLPLTRKPGARIVVTLTCTQAAGRFTVEGLGWEPGSGTQAA